MLGCVTLHRVVSYPADFAKSIYQSLFRPMGDHLVKTNLPRSDNDYLISRLGSEWMKGLVQKELSAFYGYS